MNVKVPVHIFLAYLFLRYSPGKTVNQMSLQGSWTSNYGVERNLGANLSASFATLSSSISSFVGQNFIRFSTWSISKAESSKESTEHWKVFDKCEVRIKVY